MAGEAILRDKTKIIDQKTFSYDSKTNCTRKVKIQFYPEEQQGTLLKTSLYFAALNEKTN